jgi:serpin B
MRTALSTTAISLACLALCGLALAQPSVPSPAASAASAPAATKDIVVDAPGTPPAPVVKPTATPDRALATALSELALDLLRQGGEASGNRAVSSLSLSLALGLVHAGTQGAGAAELAGLLGTRSAGERMFTTRLPKLLTSLQETAVLPGTQLVIANRVWLDDDLAKAVPPAYAARVTQRYQADAALVNFGAANVARQAINAWVAQKTAQRIPSLLPVGAVTPTTRVVLTNAVYFKSAWDKPFDPAKTVPKPFHTTPGTPKPVPTMVDERELRMGQIDGATVMEIPFAGGAHQGFAFVVAMPAEGKPLSGLEADLDGADMAGWSAQLNPATCRLELPKFTLAPRSQPLKPALQALGVRTLFGNEADLSPLLGRAAKGVYLDSVYQSVFVTIDEQGGEAAAATGATVMVKSFALPAPVCAVDRPFVFAIVQKSSGTPLFVGRVVDPAVDAIQP